MDFEDFEGFKRIKNDKNLEIDKIYSILEDYQKEMGNLNYNFKLDDADINVDLDGKYNAIIKIQDGDIIIERYLEEGKLEDSIPNEATGKDIILAQADRMIEQIYDLIKDYMADGVITEHITSAKEVLEMSECEKKLLFDTIVIGRNFEVINENNKKMYMAIQKPINFLFSIKNMQNNMEEISLDYSKYKENKYKIVEHGFQDIILEKDNSTEKTRFIGRGSNKELKISADYTDNHYLIELNEVVIGAIDCEDPLIKENYRIEINNLKERGLVIASAVLMDFYNKKNNIGIK